jgi:hypothetical protein
VFDKNEHAKEKFQAMCPELMHDDYNKQDIPGDARYDIEIYSKINTNTSTFFDKLSEITDATYVFVCLGTDEENLSTAIKIRSLYERNYYFKKQPRPDIETVIYDSNIRDTMGVKWLEHPDEVNPQGIMIKDQSCDIHMIGDLDHFYCVHTVINSELIEEGKKVHLRYEDDDTGFWKNEYNYRSSIAKAIHERLRKKLGLNIPGDEKEWDKRTDDEKMAIGRVEHVRWNAYMRTEGYQYSQSKSKESRNDLAKLHHNLVPVTELSDDDLSKDA